MLMIRTAQNPAQNPFIIMLGMKLAARNSMATLIIMVKSPSVNIIIGKVRSLTIGRIKELTIPKMAPARKSSCQSPRKTKPGTSQSAVKIAAELAKICMITLARKLMRA